MASSHLSASGHPPDPVDLPFNRWLARQTHGISLVSVHLAYADWLQHLLVLPSKQADLIGSAVAKWLQWLQYAAQSWLGTGTAPVAPALRDKRFSRSDWNQPPFNALAQAFLLQQQWWAEAMTGVRGVSRHHEEMVAFTTRQWLDMWSPSNFIATNPQVQQKTLATGGTNLLNGWAHWWRDALAVLGDGKARGVEKFIPGQTVATTPGEVVFKNSLIELIQYRAATETVDVEPVLIIPSWIMKYYILDLTPHNSLVAYLVEQGHTVFMVSWKNPTSEDRDLAFNDYLELGVMQALQAIQRLRPQTSIHAMGYCLGGTLLAIAAASLPDGGERVLKTVTLLAAQTDFHEPGELGLFIDECQIAFLEDLMAERGYLDGRQMAGAFALINSKDLVWSKLVHEYLMGARTPMTALRAWNADATRLPARMHSEYLRRLYLQNDLAEGRYRVAGKAIRLGDIKLPLCVVGTERDHVSPWKSVYQVNRLVSGPVDFVLTAGTHNAGIVNPPAGPAAHSQAGFRAASHAPGAAPDDPQEWFDRMPLRGGSWWPFWDEWLHDHSSGTMAPAAIKALAFEGAPLPAPGLYVHQA
ncbi:MAG: alpha/beta fold hydrolase [Comamonas sp.]